MPNEQFEKQYEEFGQEILKESQEAYLAKRVEDATAKMDQILAGKRKKVAKLGGDPNEVSEETILEDVRTRAANEVPNIVHVQVPTQEPFDVGKSACNLIISNWIFKFSSFRNRFWRNQNSTKLRTGQLSCILWFVGKRPLDYVWRHIWRRFPCVSRRTISLSCLAHHSHTQRRWGQNHVNTHLYHTNTTQCQCEKVLYVCLSRQGNEWIVLPNGTMARQINRTSIFFFIVKINCFIQIVISIWFWCNKVT